MEEQKTPEQIEAEKQALKAELDAKFQASLDDFKSRHPELYRNNNQE